MVYLTPGQLCVERSGTSGRMPHLHAVKAGRVGKGDNDGWLLWRRIYKSWVCYSHLQTGVRLDVVMGVFWVFITDERISNFSRHSALM